MDPVVGDITRADGSVVPSVEISLYVDSSGLGYLQSWRGGFHRPVEEDWLFGLPAEVLHFQFADGRTGLGLVTNAQLHSRAGTQYVEVNGIGPLEKPASDSAAALLEAEGYQHSDSGFWYDQAALKVFADDYVRHHEAGQIVADLAETVTNVVKLYSDWPLAPGAQSEIDRLFRPDPDRSRPRKW
jgi:hypothetical protein